ncbi:RusA family crossover junction endodeoxyribonuclease [Vreelandella alkaliphila]|uniref:RusA family crossover junction endodeoxyribonuclease n=1 Tax=Vreelandella alkaliphila TaxID=272774 RepID=UPI0039F45004
MKIVISTDNCSFDKHCLIEESASAEITIELEFERIVSMQSKAQRQRDLILLIHNELKNFQWVISDSVTIEITWYLNTVERQETDKVGDLDNITKPLLDSLTGENGVLIDDAQIGSIHTYWLSRNELKADNVVRIKISFNNDYCFNKSDLIFIQYEGAVCTPMNVDFTSHKSIFGALSVIKARKLHRFSARKIKQLGANADRFLIVSSYDIHRTRLNGFDSSKIYSLDKFKEKCKEEGFTYRALLKLRKGV